MITVLKIVASLVLLSVLFEGIRRADKNYHNYSAAAEYITGFFGVFISIFGFYYLWW